MPRIQDDVLTALRRITRAIDLHSRSLVQRSGLTGPQLLVLGQVCRDEAASVSEIARRICLGQPTVTGILVRLERRGLVERHRSRFDRRRVLVRPTPEGRRRLEESPPLLQERFLEEFGRLQEWEQSLVLSSLQRVVGMMEAGSLEASPILVSGPIEPGGEPEPGRPAGHAS